MQNKENIQELADLLIKEKQSLAVAESVTAGLMQQSFAATENATQFFEGGVTAYNLLQKYRLLHIDEVHALSCNCVSTRVAAEMASGVRKLFGTDWGIGITGYAAPIPGSIDELFAHIAIVYKENTVLESTWLAPNDELAAVQLLYVDKTVDAFLEMLRTCELVLDK
jgi:nicotinamide-nucleotide amidase